VIDPKHCCLELDCPGCIIDAKMLRDLQDESDRQRARAEAAEKERDEFRRMYAAGGGKATPAVDTGEVMGTCYVCGKEETPYQTKLTPEHCQRGWTEDGNAACYEIGFKEQKSLSSRREAALTQARADLLAALSLLRDGWTEAADAQIVGVLERTSAALKGEERK
jgi:hypothetical protein